jgi:hypothetical protein
MLSSADTPFGTVWGDQEFPSVAVCTMAAPGPSDDDPMAVQVDVSGQEIAVNAPTTAGYDCVVQVAPPFVVPMMLADDW